MLVGGFFGVATERIAPSAVLFVGILPSLKDSRYRRSVLCERIKSRSIYNIHHDKYFWLRGSMQAQTDCFSKDIFETLSH
jgi:hypothetical protein